MDPVHAHRFRKITPILLGVVVILIVVFVLFSRDKKDISHNEPVAVVPSSQQNTPTSQQQTQVLPSKENGVGYEANINPTNQGPEQYTVGDPRMFTNKFGSASYITSSNLPLLKTAERTIDPAKAKVYLIGKLDGQHTSYGYEKFLALATYEFQSYSSIKPNPEPFAKSYIYFVSDEKGNPQAWDTKFARGVSIFPEGDLIGFSRIPSSDLSNIFPKGFGVERTENFSLSYANYNGPIFSSESLQGLTRLDGYTFHDLQVYRQKDAAPSSTFIADRYFAALPFGGKFIQLFPFAGVNLDGHVIGSYEDGVFWNSGGINTVDKWATAEQPYATPYSEEGTFLKLCPNIITKTQLDGAMVHTGTTSFGTLLYEIDGQKFPKVYECLLANSWQDIDHKLSMSLSDFKKTHPMFFIKHPAGEWIEVIRTNFHYQYGHD